ncbi:hypothetical protein Hanom_Chr12g01169211 [Helianthus anomalus]
MGPTRRVTTRNRFCIRTVSVRIEFRTETGFGTGRVLDRNGSVRIGFGPTWVSARDVFRIATGFRPTRVSARDEFRSQQVLGRHEFPHGTGSDRNGF